MKLVRGLGLICVMFFTYSASSYAVTQIVANGILMGATGVSVDGEFYDVYFKDGSCAELFDGCNESSDFFFRLADGLRNPTPSSKSVLASKALLDQVFLDSDLGLFDSKPFLTNGCNPSSYCVAYTPMFVVPGDPDFSSATADNIVDERYESIAFRAGTLATYDFETSPFDGMVFAIWSPSAVVPVPAAVWLFGSGLIGLIGMKKRSSKFSTFSA